MKYEKYEHHGSQVWVRRELQGKHWDYCLCIECKNLKIGEEDNCPIAKKIYKTCVECNVVTPVFECPDFCEIGK